MGGLGYEIGRDLVVPESHGCIEVGRNGGNRTKKELLLLKQAKAKEVKLAETKVQRLKKKADQLTNNDLMEVFMLRTSEEKRRMEREMQKTAASSSAASSSGR